METISRLKKHEKLSKYLRSLLIRAAVSAVLLIFSIAASRNEVGERLVKKYLFYEVDIARAAQVMSKAASEFLPI